MDLKSLVSLRTALFITPTVFFSGLLVLIIVCGVLSRPVPGDMRSPVMNAYDMAYIIPYLISFCGSAILLQSFQEKPSYRKFIIPFFLITASGILFYSVKFFLSGSSCEWPLVPIVTLSATVSNLLLAPAITLLLYPLVKEMKTPGYIPFTLLVLLSLLATGLAFLVFADDILPVLDPEFVWSKFWDFSPTGSAGMYYGFYLLFGWWFAGGLSLVTIDDYLKNTALSEGGS